jgi:AcrR family transcriptional regulator
MSEDVPLRARQAQQIRAAVLDAVLSELERQSAGDVSMADVAKSAGISLRTLYRYFPDRPSLLRAAGEHLYGSLGVPFDIAGPEEISKSLLDAAGRLSTRPRLAHALVRTTAGQTARSEVREQRVDALVAALKPLTDNVDPTTARQATAVITHLCSAASWVTLAEESGLDDAEAQQAVAWAIDALVSTLRTARPAARIAPEEKP